MNLPPKWPIRAVWVVCVLLLLATGALWFDRPPGGSLTVHHGRKWPLIALLVAVVAYLLYGIRRLSQHKD